jgi:hypothetical protein
MDNYIVEKALSKMGKHMRKGVQVVANVFDVFGYDYKKASEYIHSIGNNGKY